MPSQRVPDEFHRGSPAVSVVSRWMCGSTNGGRTSPPAASISTLGRPLRSGGAARLDGGDPAILHIQVDEVTVVEKARAAHPQLGQTRASGRVATSAA